MSLSGLDSKTGMSQSSQFLWSSLILPLPMLLFRLTPGLLPSSSPLPPLFKNGAKSNLVFCVVLLISALPLLAALFLFFSHKLKKNFHFSFVVKYLCSDLMLHQFSCLFLDFLISKKEVSKWCDLKLCVCFWYPSQRRIASSWSFFGSCLGCVLNNENTFWLLENAVCSEVLHTPADFMNQFLSVLSFKRAAW